MTYEKGDTVRVKKDGTTGEVIGYDDEFIVVETPGGNFEPYEEDELEAAN